MNTKAHELAVQETPAVERRSAIHAVAVNATEMAEANTQIREFLVAKIEALKLERADISEAGSIAEQNGWKTGALTRTEMRLAKQVQYYDKLLQAVDAGFTIVPNMPCDQFAIRVRRAGPSVGTKSNTSAYGKQRPFVPDEKEQVLDASEGRYVSPQQLVEESVSVERKDGKELTTVISFPTEFDAIEFPFQAAVPVVMTATHAAMTLKLFDRIGLVPQQVKRNADPIVLGQIILRQNGQERVTSFLIAWHLDMRTL